MKAEGGIAFDTEDDVGGGGGGDGVAGAEGPAAKLVPGEDGAGGPADAEAFDADDVAEGGGASEVLAAEEPDGALGVVGAAAPVPAPGVAASPPAIGIAGSGDGMGSVLPMGLSVLLAAKTGAQEKIPATSAA